jgi:hypothetical protein
MDISEYPDTTRSEIINLDKNLLDYVNAHDWGLARQFIRRIANISTRKKGRDIKPSVGFDTKSNETK